MNYILSVGDNKHLAASIAEYTRDNFNITPPEVQVIDILSLDRAYDEYVIDHLDGPIYTDYYGLRGANVTRLEELDVAELSERMACGRINPKVWFTDDLATAKKWLATYDAKFLIVACDFEATDLTIPQFNPLTMLSISWSYNKSTVIVFKTKEIEKYVLNWLVTTKVKQVWHNFLYDGRLINYHTGKLPHDVEDSQLLAAVYNNYINPIKRKSGLKELAGTLYGDWASAKTSFDLYDTSMNASFLEE